MSILVDVGGGGFCVVSLCKLLEILLLYLLSMLVAVGCNKMMMSFTAVVIVRHDVAEQSSASLFGNENSMLDKNENSRRLINAVPT